MSAVAELLCLIERLEELHTEVQRMISSPHLATTLLFNVMWRWSLYLNRSVAASALESLDALGCQVLFLIKPILAELEGGRYVGLILPMSLRYLVSMANSRDGCDGGSGEGGGGSGCGSSGGNSGDTSDGSGANATKIKSSTPEGDVRVQVRYD